MADHLSIARPYAKAVFAQAEETQQLGLWSALLHILAGIASDEQAQQLLKNPKVSVEQLNTLFVETTRALHKDLKAELSTELKNFVALLSLDHRLVLLPDIEAIYHQLLAEKEGRIEVQVIYAKDITAEIKQKLQAQLEKRFNSKVDIEYTQDEHLIGGAIIKTADWVIDGSVKGRLAKLHDSLSV